MILINFVFIFISARYFDNLMQFIKQTCIVGCDATDVTNSWKSSQA